MSKFGFIRDEKDLQHLPQGLDAIFSVKPTPNTTPIGFDQHAGKDLSLLAFAGAMLTVGRTKLEEIYLPHLAFPEAEAKANKIINYFASKSLEPHTIQTFFYGDLGSGVRTDHATIASDPIVLMGGGTDSGGIYAYYCKKGLKPIGLYYEYGQAAKAYERKAIFDLAEHFHSSAIRIPISLTQIRRKLNKFSNISMEGAFPARNWLFYLTTLDRLLDIGASEIAVSVFKGEFDDHHPDHSPITLQDYQDLIDIYLGPNKCKVVVPMRELDKSDAVFWYKEKIEERWPIDKTRSCYGMFHRIDGACTGCMNKFVAMAAAGYDMLQTQFYTSKWKSSTGEKTGSRIIPTSASKYYHKYFQRALEGKNYADERNSEIMWVMNKYQPTHKSVQAELAELKVSHNDRITSLVALMDARLVRRNSDLIEQSMDEARTKPLV